MLSLTLLLKLTLVAASALLSSLVARRFGHGICGTLAGMPMIAGPIMGFVLLQTGIDEVRAIALATLVCLPATVAHLITFAWSSTRWPWPVALLLANAAFFGLGSLLPLLPFASAACALFPLTCDAVGASNCAMLASRSTVWWSKIWRGDNFNPC